MIFRTDPISKIITFGHCKNYLLCSDLTDVPVLNSMLLRKLLLILLELQVRIDQYILYRIRL